MAVGPSFDANQLRWRAYQLATRRRQLESEVQEFQAYVDREDTAGRLVGAGFPADEAAEFKRLADLHGTLAGVYYGTTAQPDPYDFDDAFTVLRGPGVSL